LVRRQLIIMTMSHSCLWVYFGVDEFITIADNLAEIEATFESIWRRGAGSCTNL
jgi:hypothetical protein